MSTVIEQYEQQDNSFRTRWGKDLKDIQQVEQWWYAVSANIGSNRSTTCESDLQGIGLYDTFAVTVKTTKKAISDKRYLEPLNSPPIGWCVMGMTVDRKESTIVVQYVKETDYLTSHSEIINEFLKWSVAKFIGEIKEAWEKSVSDLSTLMTDITKGLQTEPTNGNHSYSLERNFGSLEEIRNIHRACGAILYYLNEQTLANCTSVAQPFDKESLQLSVWRAMNNLAQNQKASGRLRFNYLNDQWCNPNSKHQIAFNWKEGEQFPQSVWSDMTYAFIQNP